MNRNTRRDSRSPSPLRNNRLAVFNAMTRNELADEYFNVRRTIPVGLTKQQIITELMAVNSSPHQRRRSPSPRRRSPSPRRRSPSPRRRSPSPRRRSPSPQPYARFVRHGPLPGIRRPIIPPPIQHLVNIPLHRRRGSR